MVKTITIGVVGLALAACGGETFDVGVCASPGLTARGGTTLSRVQVLRIGFQEVEGDAVVAEEIVQGSVDGFSARGVADSGASVSIWVEGLESADATRPIITGSSTGPTRVDGFRAVCICVTEPPNWEAECAGVTCSFDGGQCAFP